MSGKFARAHASALAKVQAKGQPVVFTRTGVSAYDDATDVTTPGADITIAGFAIAVAKNPTLYQSLGLVMTDAPLLEFVASSYGDKVPMGATVAWGGATYTVKSVLPVAPDGVPILSKVVVAL